MSSDPEYDFVEITVYCQDATHAKKKCIVTRYSRLVDDPGFGWGEHAGRSARQQRIGWRRDEATIPSTPPDKPQAEQFIGSTDEPLQELSLEAWDGHRKRHRLQCELCRFTVVARDEKLSDVLDRLRGAGVFEVSLSLLGAILR